jgi:hypothetical protein
VRGPHIAASLTASRSRRRVGAALRRGVGYTEAMTRISMRHLLVTFTLMTFLIALVTWAKRSAETDGRWIKAERERLGIAY